MSSLAFTRTPQGLTNQAIFLGVDLLVFAEGGSRTLSISEVEQGLENGDNPDSDFWRAIFEAFASKDKRVHVKSVGSKSAVEAVARQIVASRLTKVVAAMDRDLDEDRGLLILHPNILYTKGYSWENDVWSFKNIEALIRLVIVHRKSRSEASVKLKEFFHHLERCFHSAVRFDRSLAAAGLEPIPREALMDTIRPSPPGPPLLRRNDLAFLIIRIRKLQPQLRRHKDCKLILPYLHGHTLSRAALNFLQFLMPFRMSNVVLTTLALTNLVRRPNASSLRHYRTCVEKIDW